MKVKALAPAALVIVTALALTGCSTPKPSGDKDLGGLPVEVTLVVAANGLLYIPDSGNYCKGFEDGKFKSIHGGAKVLIENAAGKTLTTASLSMGTPSDDLSACTFGATAFVKPTGDHFYEIELPGFGSVQFSAPEMWSSSTTLVLDADGNLTAGSDN